MKKALALALVLIFTLALVPAVLADEIYCIHPACPGYCYVYDQPDDMNGRNLGRMDNGTSVTVLDYTSTYKGGWYYISGYNTKGKFVYGYVHDYSVSTGNTIGQYTQDYPRDMVVECYDSACPGYCYVYDQPSDMTGRNLGRMDNGTRVTAYRYDDSGRSGWYYISGYNTKGKFVYGYVHYYSVSDVW